MTSSDNCRQVKQVDQVDYDRKASILVEARYFGFPKTAKKWGISERTIYRYQAQIDTCQELSSVFQQKMKEFASEWSKDAAVTMRVGLGRLQDLFVEGNPKEATLIDAIAGAIKVVGELNITSEALKDDD